VQSAAKRATICRKTQCILPQNAVYYAAKCNVICRKMQGQFAAKRRGDLPQNATG